MHRLKNEKAAHAGTKLAGGNWESQAGEAEISPAGEDAVSRCQVRV